MFARDQVYASIGAKGRLEEDRLIAAVLLLLRAFPALGAELDLQDLPSLDLRNPKFPVSCTSWTEGSAEELNGQNLVAHSLHLPIYDRLEVMSGHMIRLHVVVRLQCDLGLPLPSILSID